jgi:hypothetical protein
MLRFTHYLKQDTLLNKELFEHWFLQRSESNSLNESEGSSTNEQFGVAYEVATALHLHHMTGSKTNRDPEHVKRMQEMDVKGRAAFDKLPEHLKNRVLQSSHNSASAYLDSLKTNRGINPQDIHEVHHTSKGIDHLTHTKADRIQNPHDVVVKTKDGKLHGASLKATQGTLSNNGIGTFDKQNGEHIKTDVSKIWEAGKKKAGLEGKSSKEVKEVRDDPKVKAINKETQANAAKHHAEKFNSASVENQRKHLRYIMKSEKPAVPYDYVNGEKKKSVPSDKLDHAVAIEKSKSFKAVHSGDSNMVKIVDDQGRHVATVEHRPTHGAFSGVQVNTKIGTMKELKA